MWINIKLACIRSRRRGTKHDPFKRESYHIVVEGKEGEDQVK
jgi:hypothetical protein